MSQADSFPDTIIKYDSPQVVEVIGRKKHKQVAPPVANPQQALIDFLDSIIPPKKYVEDGLEYLQHASTMPSSRSDILYIEDQLDWLLKEKKARQNSMCPIRNAIFEECFYEITRQVAIDSTERASLLIDIFNEIKESVSSYQTQYESIMAHGIRKAVHGEQSKNALKEENDNLERDIKNFEDKVRELKRRMEEAEANDAADTEMKEREHSERMAVLRVENAAIRQKLEDLLVSSPTQEESKEKKK